MEFDISGNPSYGDLTIALAAGESIWAEGGAMSRMSSHLELQTRLVSGLVKSVIRRLVGGESLLISEYTAPQMAFVALSPACPGSVLHRKMTGERFLLTAGSFLACTPGLAMETRFGGLRALLSGEGGFVLEISGQGDLFFSSYGGVVERDVDGEFIVDTGHVVAWEPTLSYTIGGMGGMKQTLFSGEGLVMRFQGRGKIFLQTRQLPALAGWLTPYCAQFRGHDVMRRLSLAGESSMESRKVSFMQIEILGDGAFESALVHLQPGERFISESGALYRASGNVQIDVTTSARGSGGILGGVKRLLARENFFFSTYSTSDGRPGEVGLAPTHQGELMVIDVEPGTHWLCAGGSYLGSTAGLNVNTQFQGMKGFVTGESLVFLDVSGSGQLLVNAFGRLVESDVDQSITVDTGHLVAFESTLQYEITKAGKSWIQSWLAGEGVVMKFTGQGRIITQSHNPRGFGATLGRLLPPRK